MSKNCNLCVYHTGGACNKSQCTGDVCLTEFSYMIYNQALEDFAEKIKLKYSLLKDEMPNEYNSVCNTINEIKEQMKR